MQKFGNGRRDVHSHTAKKETKTFYMLKSQFMSEKHAVC